VSEILRAPFPYPGGKRRVAEVCWRAFGADVASYIELCAGSCAMLFGRPAGTSKYELVNDWSGLVANVWRAIQLKPGPTALACDGPPSELDLRARSRTLAEIGPQLRTELAADPLFCDPTLAGWWIWCQSVALGPDWLATRNPAILKPYRRGILSLDASEPGVWLAALSDRLRRVSIACGDWSRLVTDSALGFHTTGTTPTAVFADPPYADEELDYGAEAGTAARIAAWCLEHGADQRLRIVLAGHVGDYELPGWRTLNWGGSSGWGSAKRGANECLWFSPHCLPFETAQRGLFEQTTREESVV
jgi:hypothetical protein